MRVVLDTNVILVSIPRQSKYRLIFEKILNKSLQVIISTDISPLARLCNACLPLVVGIPLALENQTII